MVYIVKTHWAGLQGGPGITQLAFDTIEEGNFLSAESAQDVVNAMRSFWVAINNEIPNDVSLTVDPVIDAFVDATGVLTTSFQAATPPTAVTGASASSYSAASGAKIRLSTAGIKNNRRVRGAIFLVPLSSNAYDSNGSVASSIGTQVASGWTALNASMALEGLTFGVWSRPIGGIPGTGGSFHPLTGMSVGSKVAVLRGRRG